MVPLIAILFLLILSASFSSLETALFSLSPVERRKLKQAGGVSAFITKTLDRPRELLTTVLFGNELVNVAISILAGSLALELWGEKDIRLVYLVSIAVTTLIILIVGEIVPKNIAVRNALLVSQVLILPYRLFSLLVTPFRVALAKIVDSLVGVAGLDPEKGRRLIVEEEFRDLLELGGEEGGLAPLETGLIRGALDFSNVRVHQIMTPRQKIVAVPQGLSLPAVLKRLHENRFSRIPVYEGDLNNVVGVLFAKDLLPHRVAHPDPVPPSLQEILKPFATVDPGDSLDEVFQKFRSRQVHMGIVRGDRGSVLGLVTMDDLLRRFFT